jgi:ketosteroid isomerase-like protein
MITRIVAMLSLVLLPLCTEVQAETLQELTGQVREAEIAFAKTMADRDVRAFETFLADDAVFFGQTALRGKAAVVNAWKGFFDGAEAPFSWRPEIVEVLETGELALSSGPVFDPQGKQTATFNSIWRRAADGRWKVVFDKGTCVCEQRKPQ